MIRVRHPNGTSTISVTSTLQDLHALTDIPPNQLDFKTGYPPKSISLISVSPSTALTSPPFSLKKGEQILLANKGSNTASSSSSTAPSTTFKPSLVSKPVIPASIPTPFSKPAPPPTKIGTLRDGEVFVEVEGSYLTLKIVPDDNSCLFNATGFAFQQRLGSDICMKLRRVVIDAIRSNPIDYSDAMLGQSRETYMSKMLDPKAWGGAIELSILSKHFSTQIVSIDVGSGMLNKFGEDEGYETTVIVVYSGIHYDALCLLPTPDAPAEFGATQFPTFDSSNILEAAVKLVADLRRRHYYTDTATFTLKCNTCGSSLEGEKEATSHAMKTGHTDFGEFE